MEKLTAVIYNDCKKVCLFVFVRTNICKTELFNPRNPYDTDLPVISNARELFVFFFFRVFFWFGARRVVFFCWLLVVVRILSRDV